MQKLVCSHYDNAYEWHISDYPAPILCIGDTGSVLDDAWALLAKDKFPLWSCVLARSQSAGRGQTRRKWQSPEGNIYVAMRLPNEAPFNSTAAAPALSALIIKSLNSLNCFVQLKWPNDLVDAQKNCKVAGILLEEKQGVLIAGIGINLVNAPEAALLREDTALLAGVLPLATNIDDFVTINNNNLLNDEISLYERLWLYLARKMYFCYTNSPASWSNMWREEIMPCLLWLGQSTSLKDTDKTVTGILSGLGPLGELELFVNGQKHYFLNGSLNLYQG